MSSKEKAPGSGASTGNSGDISNKYYPRLLAWEAIVVLLTTPQNTLVCSIQIPNRLLVFNRVGVTYTSLIPFVTH